MSDWPFADTWVEVWRMNKHTHKVQLIWDWPRDNFFSWFYVRFLLWFRTYYMKLFSAICDSGSMTLKIYIKISFIKRKEKTCIRHAKHLKSKFKFLVKFLFKLYVFTCKPKKITLYHHRCFHLFNQSSLLGYLNFFFIFFYS